MKLRVKCLLLMAFSILSKPVFSGSLGEDLSLCAITQYEMLSAYHELGNSPNERSLASELNEKNILLSSCIQALNGRVKPAILRRLQESNSKMNGDLAYTLKTLQQTGAPHGQSSASMIDHALDTTRLMSSIASSPAMPGSGIRKLAVSMAYLENRYLERAYSLGEQASRENSKELPIEALVIEFSDSLDELRNKKIIKNKPLVYEKLQDAHVRFNFIKQPLVNYNKKSVPFLVSYHAKLIKKALLIAAADADR